MITPEQIQAVKNSISQAKSIIIFTLPTASYDMIASALAMYLALKDLGKQVSIHTSEPLGEQLMSLEGAAAVTDQVGNKNLQISFDYQESAVDKVSYHIDDDNQKFHLVIQPKPDMPPLDASTVTTTYTGADADLLFFVGVGSLDELGVLYEGYPDLFNNTTSVSINNYQPTIGSIRLDTSGAATTSESMAFLFQELDLPLTSGMATNLLAGIEEATDGFRSLAATADTFQIVSQLLRAGARRQSRRSAGSVSSLPSVARLGGSSASAYRSGPLGGSSSSFASALQQQSSRRQPVAPSSIANLDEEEQEDDNSQLMTDPDPSSSTLSKLSPAATVAQSIHSGAVVTPVSPAKKSKSKMLEPKSIEGGSRA